VSNIAYSIFNFRSTVPRDRGVHMSERSIYLRDQATKCRGHADSMTDLETKVALRKLAAEYVAQAAAIEASDPID
jgi:hypothetical protein